MTDETTRTATCQCGGLTVETRGEPEFIPICGCSYCRRRSGAVYGTGVYFNKDQVSIGAGETKTFRRSSDAGRWFDCHFCTTCGTTLYWTMEIWPDRIGVPIGCLDGPALPKPNVAVFTKHIPDWAAFDEDITAYEAARPTT